MMPSITTFTGDSLNGEYKQPNKNNVIMIWTVSMSYCLHPPPPPPNSFPSVVIMMLQYFVPLAVITVTNCHIGYIVWIKKTPGEAEADRDRRMAASKRRVSSGSALLSVVTKTIEAARRLMEWPLIDWLFRAVLRLLGVVERLPMRRRMATTHHVTVNDCPMNQSGVLIFLSGVIVSSRASRFSLVLIHLLVLRYALY